MSKKWKTVIAPYSSIWDINLREIWQYRDLCFTYIRKNFITKYKQTVLGPLYMILAPLVTSGLFSVIFGSVAGISTDGTPQFLFYMLGNLMWSFMAGCLSENAYVLLSNAYIMGKVYFPRLVIPISNVITKAIHTMFQLFLFFVVYLIFFLRGAELHPNCVLLLVPFWFLQLAVLGTGIGLLVSALTVKYRDLGVMVGFGTNLWMYASPIIFPLSSVKGGLRTLALCNPVAPVVEAVRYACFGKGVVSLPFLLLSLGVTLCLGLTGLLMFNKVEKTFVDTI